MRESDLCGSWGVKKHRVTSTAPDLHSKGSRADLTGERAQPVGWMHGGEGEGPGSGRLCCCWGWVGRELVHSHTFSSPSFPSSPSHGCSPSSPPSHPRLSTQWSGFCSSHLTVSVTARTLRTRERGELSFYQNSAGLLQAPSDLVAQGTHISRTGSPPLACPLWFPAPCTRWLIHLY